MLTLPLLNETLNEYREVVVHGQKRDEQRKEIEAGFTKEILSINAKQTVAEWNRVSDQWFLPRYFGQRKIKKAINIYALKTIETEDIKPLLHRIIRYQEEKDAVQKYTGQLPLCSDDSARMRIGLPLSRLSMIWLLFTHIC